MALSTQPYKGARDFYPEDKRIQKYMFGKMRAVLESFGYEEYDAPILEPTDLFLAKGNEEIINEQTYTFPDRGGRSVTIRTEMTPTVSRMVAGRRQELVYPLRWYSIPNLWRYERTQRGRLREFWQLNIDVFGIENVMAEHEIIQICDELLKSYGAKTDMYTIHLSSRQLTEELFGGYLQLDATQSETLIRLIDRMKKMEHETFLAQLDAVLTPSQREGDVLDKILRLLQVKTLDDLPEEVENHGSVQGLRRLMGLLSESNITNVAFDITLMRGFDYYTDIVFEIFDTDPENNRSMFGGGRYDGLVGFFGVEPVPTVGVAAGDVTLQNFLESHRLLPVVPAETDVYVVLIGDVYQKAQRSVAELRTGGLNVAVDSTGRKPDKQIKTADKKGIHYIVTIGDAELTTEQYPLKNLHTGVEEKHSLARIISIVEDYRQRNTTTKADD